MQADGMAEFVERSAVIGATVQRQRYFVISVGVADGGVTSASVEDGDLVVVPGGFVKFAAGWSKSHASLFHPLLKPNSRLNAA